MLEFNVTIAFPAAPLLTVILALVGELLFVENEKFVFKDVGGRTHKKNTLLWLFGFLLRIGFDRSVVCMCVCAHPERAKMSM